MRKRALEPAEEIAPLRYSIVVSTKGYAKSTKSDLGSKSTVVIVDFTLHPAIPTAMSNLPAQGLSVVRSLSYRGPRFTIDLAVPSTLTLFTIDGKILYKRELLTGRHSFSLDASRSGTVARLSTPDGLQEELFFVSR